MPSVDDDVAVRVALHLDLEPLTVGAELPRWVEVLLAHQPVHADADHLGLADERLPGELLGRDLAGLDHTCW
jgi:hypothetical protein